MRKQSITLMAALAVALATAGAPNLAWSEAGSRSNSFWWPE